MVKHVWSVLAERISTDEVTHLVSFLSVIEDIYLDELPKSQENLALGTRWHKIGKSIEQLQLRVGVLCPDESTTILLSPHKLKFGNKSNDYRTNVDLSSYSFENEGLYVFQIEQHIDAKWILVAQLPVMVHVARHKRPKRKLKNSSKKDKT